MDPVEFGERAWMVHLLGYPAVGKRTVGVALAAATQGWADGRFVLIDNHLTSKPILAVLDNGGAGRVADDVWALVGEIRDVVDRAIVGLAPARLSFVFTNHALADDAYGIRAVTRVEKLAHARAATSVPVVLSCNRDELLARVPNADRWEHGRWTVPAEVGDHIDGHQILRPDSPHLLDLDTTFTSPAQSAQAILTHLAAIGATG